ncbi:hypothetical protein F5B22DRAFT_86188 [Xylaria bambusicola]|uniref:uncharacterized protein n=1 Tax=Xylaria bambusicola TaxID=326684 RepID=UPI0020078E9B|nr:uncharacterized protein F5B22DRAFT_86188 [Xylaria bambusicola]KAI0517966.1 hypothetical protein F5B22DRAFT_86188 [Xylaria bambusicola]
MVSSIVVVIAIVTMIFPPGMVILTVVTIAVGTRIISVKLSATLTDHTNTDFSTSSDFSTTTISESDYGGQPGNRGGKEGEPDNGKDNISPGSTAHHISITSTMSNRSIIPIPIPTGTSFRDPFSVTSTVNPTRISTSSLGTSTSVDDPRAGSGSLSGIVVGSVLGGMAAILILLAIVWLAMRKAIPQGGLMIQRHDWKFF